MGENFLKFKKRLGKIRLLRSLMTGGSCGLAGAGIWLILTKLTVIDSEPLYAIFIGLGLALAGGAITFILCKKSDKALAEELDMSFGLKARVQTMIAYKDEDGDLINLQREDAERSLDSVPVNAYRFKNAGIHLTALVLSLTILLGGVFVEDMRYHIPEEEIEAFSLSDMQRAGLDELVKYVESSGMEEEFRTPIADELRRLRNSLEQITTVPDMRAELALSMATICDVTYRSSTSAEMLDALWESNNVYLRYLAVALDTSSWSSPDWGGFAEGIIEYSGVLMGDNNEDENALHGVASLRWALNSMDTNIKVALDMSGVDSNDEIYTAIDRLFNANPGGLNQILASIDYYDDTTAREALNQCLNMNSSLLFDAVSLNRINAVVGEYTMTRLSSLFLVPVPEFERPEFVKNGELPDGSHSSGSDKENNGTSDGGGVGSGAQYGSNDIVLDPITGEPVPYAELIDKYYAIMNERLQSGSYTEEQKDAIIKYFDLLIKGVEKKEGN